MHRPFPFCILLILVVGLFSSVVACDQKNVGQVRIPVVAQPVVANAKVEAVKTLPGDWPQWRGPKADGISRDTNWTADWPTEGPRQVWKAAIGTGFSSMAVVGDKLYAMGHSGGNDTVFCLDAQTGKEAWKYSYPCKLVDNLHEGGPGATPTVDEDRVYTISKEGHLFCLNAASGDVKWKAEFQPLLEVKMPEWGFSGSVVVLGDTLIVDSGRLVAFNKLNGDVLWKTDRYRPGYGTPTLFQHDGEDLIAWLNNDALVIVRAKDGVEIDKSPWETQFVTTACTPIVHGNAIFISTGYNRGCAVYDLKDGKLEQRYEVRTMRNHMANCVLWDGHLYGVDGNSHAASSCHVKCIDFAMGTEKWRHRGLGCGTLLIAGDKLIVLSDSGELVVAPLSSEAFEPIAKAQVLEGRCWTVPVLARGLIYCRNAEGDLVCVDVRKSV
jgi:outer membrane protein assembly factor BamB